MKYTYFKVLFVFKMDIELSSVDSIHSVLHSFTSVDSRISVLDFRYFIPFVCIKQSEVKLFMTILLRPLQISIDVILVYYVY